MTDEWSVTSEVLSITFRRVAGTKLPNKYICFEEYFKSWDSLRRKPSNTTAQLKIPQAVKNCGLY